MIVMPCSKNNDVQNLFSHASVKGGSFDGRHLGSKKSCCPKLIGFCYFSRSNAPGKMPSPSSDSDRSLSSSQSSFGCAVRQSASSRVKSNYNSIGSNSSDQSDIVTDSVSRRSFCFNNVLREFFNHLLDDGRIGYGNITRPMLAYLFSFLLRLIYCSFGSDYYFFSDSSDAHLTALDLLSLLFISGAYLSYEVNGNLFFCCSRESRNHYKHIQISSRFSFLSIVGLVVYIFSRFLFDELNIYSVFNGDSSCRFFSFSSMISDLLSVFSMILFSVCMHKVKCYPFHEEKPLPEFKFSLSDVKGASLDRSKSSLNGLIV